MSEPTETHDTSVYIAYRVLPDGRIIGVLPLLLGQAQIVVGRADSCDYSDEWMYAQRALALAAFYLWDGEPGTEPDSWTRHKPSGRRRYYDNRGELLREESRE